MTYHVTHKPSYNTDFIELSKDLQKRTVDAIEIIRQAPATPHGNTIKPLTGYDNVWRYRLGDHRLIYAVAPGSPVIQLLAIGPRSSVYERFNYDGWDDESFTRTFDAKLAGKLAPKKEEAPEWAEHPEWFQPERETDGEADKAWLPRRLTPELLSRWLIPEQFHPALTACRTEDDLLTADVPAHVTERVMDALWPADVQRLAQQPDQLLVRPEDLEAYAEGSLQAFLLHLDERQRHLVDWALSGPTLVKGGPGSGKSTVALYRIRALVEHALEEVEENGRPPEVRDRAQNVPDILFTTYTNALINASQSLLQQLLHDVLDLDPGDDLPAALRITTLDKTVYWIVKAGGHDFNFAGRDQQVDALRHARNALHPRELGDLDKLLLTTALQNLRNEYLLEEFEWVVEGQDCRSEADYLEANRAGRGIPFNQSLRRAVWQLYEAYRDFLQGQGLYTWGQLRQKALDEVRSGAFERRWDYVIVDEAQDLPPAALALCVELARDPSGLFLTADANQSLYNRGFRWSHVHEQLQVVGRTRILRRNYRSTQDIAEAAAELMAGTEDYDPDAMEQEYVHSGHYPYLYAATGAADQAEWLARQLWQAAKDLRLPVNAAAVLVSSSSLGKPLAAALEEQGLPARFTTSRDLTLEDRSVKVLTLHAAKGLEFPIVAIAHVEAGRLPRETGATDAQEKAEHLNNERRLFYVGCTRAMRYLFVTYDRSLPSPFLEQLSDERWMRVE